jgi:ketosteroid isomerase-like protein
MHPNATQIEKFYRAFQQLDAEQMAQCYAPEVHFSDPVFTELRGKDASDMWRMLCSRAEQFSLTFDGVKADDHQGEAHWVATYKFSQTGRMVVNDIHARFEFKDGKIIRHRDYFNFWKWAKQALGLAGSMLGWHSWLKNKVQYQASKSLRKFQKQQSDA